MSGLAHGHNNRRHHHRGKGRRQLGDETLDAKDQQQGTHPNHGGRPIPIANLRDGRPQLLEGVAIGDLNAKELAELADDDLDGHAGNETGHNGL